MPYPLLAHQAPVLPLKLWRPAWFNGTALVIGSMAPDLQNFWNHMGTTELAHTVPGQLVFCLPITLAVTFAIGKLDLGTVLAARFGARMAWLMGAARPLEGFQGVLRATSSALVGSFSHIGFDKLTHDVVPRYLPQLRLRAGGASLSAHATGQAVASLLGAMMTVWMLWLLARRNVQQPPAHRTGAAFVVGLAVAGAAGGVVRALPAIRNPDWYFEVGRVYVYGYVVFLATAAALAGTLIAAVLLAWRDRATRQTT